jgi:hypothetical protein
MNTIKKTLNKLLNFILITPILYFKKKINNKPFNFILITIICISFLMALLGYILFWGERLISIFLLIGCTQFILLLSIYNPNRKIMKLLLTFSELIITFIALFSLFELSLLITYHNLGFNIFFLFTILVLNLQSMSQKIIFKKVTTKRNRYITFLILYGSLLAVLIYQTNDIHFYYLDFITNDAFFPVVKEWFSFFVIGVDLILNSILKGKFSIL